MNEEQKKLNEELVTKVLENYKNGNVCYRDRDGIHISPMSWFTDQPLEGILYDMGRDRATITKNIDDQKWVNDLCLSEVLRHYYEENIALKKKLEAYEKASI